MHDVAVIDQPEVARIALDPIRARILRALVEPGSASTVAAALDLPRQKVNYHLRLLEEHGLVELVEERPRRGLTERVLAASAASWALAPEVMGECSATTHSLDRLSSSYLVALGARLVSEVGALARRARAAGKPLATLSIDTELTFATPAERAAFADELAATVTAIAAKYHAEDAADGRPYRLIVASHPIAPPADQKESTP